MALVLAGAREAYAAARTAADAAYAQIMDPAQARYAKAEQDAIAIDGRVDRGEVDARLRAGARAREVYRSIVAGPEADVDEALRAAGIDLSV
jgi:hypothetical protein